MSILKSVVLGATSGLAAALAFAPAALWPLAWCALAPAWWALGRDASRRRAAALGAGYGAVFCIVGMGWLRHATPVALAGLAIYFALYYAGFFSLTRRLCAGEGRFQPLVLAATWVAGDFLIGRLFTGIPWLFLGYTQVSLSPLIQIADATGVHGVTFLCAAGSAFATRAARRWLARVSFPWPSLAIWVALVGAALGYGLSRDRDAARESEDAGRRLKVAVIQPNIEQSLKDSAAVVSQEKVVRLNDELSRQALAAHADLDLVIWAETMNPYRILGEGASFRPGFEAWGAVARRYGTAFLLGTPYWLGPVEPGEPTPRYMNSAVLFGFDGAPLARYDKLHPIPWGEYVPLQIGWLEGLITEFAGFPLMMVAGTEATVFSLGPGAGLPAGREAHGRFGALICFDVIYPRYARRMVRDGADFLVNLTNEAWFLDSGEFDQLLAQSIFRAIENRTDVVRATNSGISAWIDYRGEVQQRIEVNGVDRAVAGRLVCRPFRGGGGSLYTRIGDAFAGVCAAIAALAVLLGLRRARTQPVARKGVTKSAEV